MINSDDITRGNIKKKHYPSYSQISDHLYRILIIKGSRSGKINALINLMISHQPYIDEIYMYAKDPYKVNYQLLINKRKSVALSNCNDSNCKAFLEHSNDMDDIYENIKEYYLNEEHKMLIVFDDILEIYKY